MRRGTTVRRRGGAARAERRAQTSGGQRTRVRGVTIKVPPKGTRGIPFPRALSRVGAAFVRRQFRRGTLRTQGGVATLLLGTIGAKSGLRRQAALGYLEDGPDSWLVIASMAGARYHPAWLHNLAAHPDAEIQFKDGPQIPVRAEALGGPDLEAAWERIARDAPEYVKYRSKTDRELVVVRLRRRPDA
jgi:deazaflavin-dependent oxidoreductase (nitroreductase family)